MKTLVIIFLFFLLVSCSNKIMITGTYSRINETLELKSDSTFIYMYRIERPLSASKGIWRQVNENEIMLTSTYHLDNLPVEVIESRMQNENVQFKIEPKESFDPSLMHNLEFGVVIDGLEIVRKNDVLIEVPASRSCRTIRINIYYIFNDLPVIHATRESLSTASYEVKSTAANFFRISFPLEPEMFYSETIEDDTIEVKSNKLYWPRKGRPYFKRLK